MSINNAIIFIYESTISLGILYLFYFILLRKEGMHGFNRAYLIGSLLFSCILPFLGFTISGLEGSGSGFVAVINRIGNPGLIPEVKISPDDSTGPVFLFSGISLLVFAYLVVTILIFARFISGMVRVLLLLKRLDKTRHRDFLLVSSTKKYAPFSFFKTIFVNPGLINNDQLNFIVEHEAAHARQFHTIDIIVVEILSAICWINPVVWLVRRSLKETHEYLADRAVLQHSRNLADYQNMLLSQVSGFKAPLLSNCFNRSILKKRIIMMTTRRSTRFISIKLLLVIPVILFITWVFACSRNESDMTVLPETKQVEELPQITYGEDSIPDSYMGREVFFIVEDMPTFQGKEIQAFRYYIAENLQYPEFCKENNIGGKVYVQFILDYTGKVSYARIARGVHPELDAEAIRVTKSSPLWEPGKQRGKEVNVMFTFPINFVLN